MEKKDIYIYTCACIYRGDVHLLFTTLHYIDLFNWYPDHLVDSYG